MRPAILRLLALAAITLAYWFVAIMVAGALLIGDCFENEACYSAKRRDLDTWLIAAPLLYLAIIVPTAWRMFRRRGG